MLLADLFCQSFHVHVTQRGYTLHVGTLGFDNLHRSKPLILSFVHSVSALEVGTDSVAGVACTVPNNANALTSSATLRLWMARLAAFSSIKGSNDLQKMDHNGYDN